MKKNTALIFRSAVQTQINETIDARIARRNEYAIDHPEPPSKSAPGMKDDTAKMYDNPVRITVRTINFEASGVAAFILWVRCSAID